MGAGSTRQSACILPGEERIYIREKTGSMRNRESQIQIACVNYFKAQYPNVLIAAFPNGGKRPVVKNKRGVTYCAEGAKLKREGAKKGMPDLFIPKPLKGFHGLFIEMKQPGKTTSPDQKKVIAQLQSEGYRCEIAYSLDDFMNVVNDYLK